MVHSRFGRPPPHNRKAKLTKRKHASGCFNVNLSKYLTVQVMPTNIAPTKTCRLPPISEPHNALIALGPIRGARADLWAVHRSRSVAKRGFDSILDNAVTNTAMGPLLAHIEIQSNSGTGFGPLGNGAVLNAGYVQWAGITAGKHGSFYDYLAGGDTWKDFFSPDHSVGPINLLAYTASFGGGFLATLSLEQNEFVAGVNLPYTTTTSRTTRADQIEQRVQNLARAPRLASSPLGRGKQWKNQREFRIRQIA